MAQQLKTETAPDLQALGNVRQENFQVKSLYFCQKLFNPIRISSLFSNVPKSFIYFHWYQCLWFEKNLHIHGLLISWFLQRLYIFLYKIGIIEHLNLSPLSSQNP